MKIIGTGNVTYILLNGIAVQDNIKLSDCVELQTADTSHLNLETTLSVCTHPDDIAVAAAFIPRITAQFKVTAPTDKELAIIAWNSSWDAILLGALFCTEVGFNLQSNVTANAIAVDSRLSATNLRMHGISNSPPHLITSEESLWIAENFANARGLLKNERFQTAAHCLATYRWHSMPRVQMAILWAGIEGMFGATTEIRFRISQYIARFLHPDDASNRKKLFDSVKKLYNFRSSAVHGSKMKDKPSTAVSASAAILCDILRCCTETNAMPDESKLAP